MNKQFIKTYGYNDFFENQIVSQNIDTEQFEVARVIEVQKESYKIVVNGNEKFAKLKGSHFYGNSSAIYPVVGDFVIVKENALGDDIIYNVLERKTKFSRLDTATELEQMVAVNFDYVFIMMSLNKDFNLKRLERYLAVAWQSGAVPIIILTKLDLCEDIEHYMALIDEVAIGIPVVAVSSFTGEGLLELAPYLQAEKTIVFLGSSGIGKSSLLNALAGARLMNVNDIREDDSKGRHTTTYRHLFKLENGSIVIDTPGMRELGMWDAAEGLESAFTDIEALAKECKFSNCNHEKEPGCAIRSALVSGELSSTRWHNYLKLKKEVAFAIRKQSKTANAAEKSKWKAIGKLQKEIYKTRKKR